MVKTLRWSAATLFFIFSLLAFRPEGEAPRTPTLSDFPVTMCSAAFRDALDFEVPPSLLDGLGDLHYPITTNVAQAQKFFDQGLRLIYAFNHVEALRAFREASRLDPSCAMAWWGQALTLGPNINDWNPKDREAMALEAIKRAGELSVGATKKEQEFIIALATRYDGAVHDDRSALNETYVGAMEKLAQAYPNDPEALVLFADAVMNSMPWDYWNKDGSPKSKTLVARKALETAIARYPRHPGAHHMYIHLVEASKRPGDARKSAEFLESAMPSAGHIVHMPSHIYVRIGEYERSNNSNRLAIKADEAFLSRSNDMGLYRLGYYPHNIDFLAYGTLMNGQSETALKEANKLAYHVKSLESSIPTYYDYYFNAPIIAMIRYGKWNDVLSLPPPDDRNYHTSALHHFGRGTAFLRMDQLDEAKKELSKLDSISKLDTLSTIYAFFNSTQQIVQVPLNILKGEILIREGKVDEGLNALKQATVSEDELRYNEPPDWRLPSRHFLGAALHEAGRHADAIKVFEEDLVQNPENGWSLKGLALSYQKLSKPAEAAAASKRFDAIWKKSDVKISSARY